MLTFSVQINRAKSLVEKIFVLDISKFLQQKLDHHWKVLQASFLFM
jgi:hypothetical protein